MPGWNRQLVNPARQYAGPPPAFLAIPPAKSARQYSHRARARFSTKARNLDAESSRRRLGKSGSSLSYQVPALTGQSARVLQRQSLGFSDEGLQLALLRLGQSSVIVLGHEKVKTGLLPGGKASQPLFCRLKGNQLRKRHSAHLANDSGNAQIQAFHGLPVVAQPVEALEIDMNALALDSLQEPGHRQPLVGQNLLEMGIGV